MDSRARRHFKRAGGSPMLRPGAAAIPAGSRLRRANMEIKIGRAWRGLAAAGAFAGALSIAGAAFAAECPADKVVGQGQGQPNANHAAKGVTDTVLSSIDLGGEKIAANGHSFRLRRLVIQPGGVVPWHSHVERPAIIYVVSGTIQEYA